MKKSTKELTKIIKLKFKKSRIILKKSFLEKKFRFKIWLLEKNLYKNNEIHYISNSESLPPPLTEEEESILLTKLNDQSEIVKQTLIKRNLRLVVYIARKFSNTKISMEDLVSIGAIGLIKAVSTFNSDKNTKFATYASKCIKNEILMDLRKTTKDENIKETSTKIDAEGKEVQLFELLGTDNDVTEKNIDEEVDKELLKKAFMYLNQREQEIISLRYGMGTIKEEEKTQKEVADKLGISQSYISRLEKKIIQKLKKYMKTLIEE